MAELDPSIVGSVSNANMKTVAEAGAFAMAQQFQIMTQALASHTAAADRRQSMADAAMASALQNMTEIDPKEAISLAESMTPDLPTLLAQLTSVVATMQQAIKGGQTTPPVTS